MTSGLVVPLLLAQGATTAEVVARVQPSILCVMGGFAIFAILAVLALPPGHQTAPAHTPTQQRHAEEADE